MVAYDSNGSIRNGIRRLLRNEWFMAVAILVTAMAVRWEFHLWNPHPTGFFIYHGSPISDGSSYTFKAINIARLRNPADTTTCHPAFLCDRPGLPLYVDWIFPRSDIGSQHCNWRRHRSVDLSLRHIGF